MSATMRLFMACLMVFAVIVFLAVAVVMAIGGGLDGGQAQVPAGGEDWGG